MADPEGKSTEARQDSFEELLNSVESTLAAGGPSIVSPISPGSLDTLLQSSSLDLSEFLKPKRAAEEEFAEIFGDDTSGDAALRSSSAAGPVERSAGGQGGHGSAEGAAAAPSPPPEVSGAPVRDSHGGGDATDGTVGHPTVEGSETNGGWKALDVAERQDFLAWLEGEESLSGGPHASPPRGGNTHTPTLSPRAATAPRPSQTVMASTSSPVFPRTSPPPPEAELPPRGLDMAPEGHQLDHAATNGVLGGAVKEKRHLNESATAPQPGPLTLEEVLQSLQHELNKVESSGVAANVAIKTLCEQYGSIPDDLRPRVWHALIPAHEALAEEFKRWSSQAQGITPSTPADAHAVEASARDDSVPSHTPVPELSGARGKERREGSGGDGVHRDGGGGGGGVDAAGGEPSVTTTDAVSSSPAPADSSSTNSTTTPPEGVAADGVGEGAKAGGHEGDGGGAVGGRSNTETADTSMSGGALGGGGSGGGLLDLAEQDVLHRDAAAVARAVRAKAGDPSDEGAEKRLTQEIEAGVTFYCKQVRIPYEPSSLVPMYGMLASLRWPNPHDAAARCHFLCSALTPYVLLNPGSSRDTLMREAHNEFRLLLTYHSPILVQHLDRACPGWEAPPPLASSEQHSVAKAERERMNAEAEGILGELEDRWSTNKPRRTHHTTPSGSTTADVERVKASAQLGVMPTVWLLGLFAGCLPLQRQLKLWDLCLLRGDRFFGFPLALALLIRHKTELLSLQGSSLRQRLEDLVSGDTPVLQGHTAPSELATGLDAVISPGSSSGGGDMTIDQWFEEADRLDRMTPTSFRVNLSALEVIAKGGAWSAHSPGKSPRKRSQPSALDLSSSGNFTLPSTSTTGTQQAPPTQPPPPPPPSSLSTSTPTSGAPQPPSATTPPHPQPPPPPPPTSSHSSSSSSSSSSIIPPPLPRPSYSKRVAPLLNPKQRAIDEQQKATQQRWNLASPTKRRRTTAAIEGDQPLQAKLCLVVAAEEVVPQLLQSLRPRAASPEAQAAKGTVFTGGTNLRFFALDCRPREHLATGRFPTAYHLEPSSMEDPDEIQRLLTTLESLKGSMHILLMGAGDRSGYVSGTGPEKAQKIREQLQRAARDDVAHVNNCALFLIKKGFPYVSIFDGGFVAAHAYLLHRRGPQVFNLQSLVDHTPANCRMCRHEALVRFHREQALADAYGGQSSGGRTGNRPLTPAEQVAQGAFGVFKLRASDLLGKVTAAGAQLASTTNTNNAATTATTPGGIELGSKPVGSGSAAGVGGGEGGRAGSVGGGVGGGGSVPGSGGATDIGSMLKGTLGLLTKRSQELVEQVGEAMAARQQQQHQHPVPSQGSIGGGAASGDRHHRTVSPKGTGGRRSPGGPATPGSGGGGGRSRHGSSVFVIEDDMDDVEEDNDVDYDDDDHAVDPEERARRRQQKAAEAATLSSRLSPTSHLASTRSPMATSGSGSGAGRKSDAEKELALRMHMINGLQKGQDVTVSTESLPGAQLFQAEKLKQLAEGQVGCFPRFIAITPERMLVLDAPDGLGTTGVVKSNHHLTELAKMTFMRKDPEVVTLYFRGANVAPPPPSDATGAEGEGQAGAQQPKDTLKKRAYRVARKDELIAILQEKLKRFKG